MKIVEATFFVKDKEITESYTINECRPYGLTPVGYGFTTKGDCTMVLLHPMNYHKIMVKDVPDPIEIKK